MSSEIMKFSNQLNNVALKKLSAMRLDMPMTIASRVGEKGMVMVEFSPEELRGSMRLRRSLTNGQLVDRVA